MKAFYAGIIIGLGAAANLLIGGLPGAVIFSFGLLMICALQYDLFTGKVGATILGEYKLGKLIAAFSFNFAGVLLVNLLLLFSPLCPTLVEKATVITQVRLNNPWYANIGLGILCGICVQLSVDGWKATKHPLPVMLPVVVFVMCGFNHCIADMFYITYGAKNLNYIPIFETAIGNIIGAALLVADRWWQVHVGRKN